MVPRIHAGGKSFSGIVEYLTHDAAIPGDRHPNTGERVGWVEVENLPDCQPRTVAAVMRATARGCRRAQRAALSLARRAG